MKLAVLFWCYKEVALCEDRLRLLRERNPDTPVYVLFGGEPADAPEFERCLAPYVDDFCAFTGGPPPGCEDMAAKFRRGSYWKYHFGDLLFAAWFRDRGRELEWDTVVVVQWDMLVYGSVDELFACLRPGEVLFSGLRPVREVEDRWIWTSSDKPRARAAYLEFLEHVRERYGYDQEPQCCVAIVMAFPRAFLERFSEIERPELGFMEYRLPIYAQVFGVPFCTDHPFTPWWGAVEGYKLFSILRALPREVWVPSIAWHLARKDGGRIFHPYWRRAPRGLLGWTWALVDSVPRLLVVGSLGGWRRLRANLREA